MTVNRSFTAITSEGGILPSDFLLSLSDSRSDIKGLILSHTALHLVNVSVNR